MPSFDFETDTLAVAHVYSQVDVISFQKGRTDVADSITRPRLVGYKADGQRLSRETGQD